MYRKVEVKVQKDTRKTNSKRQSNDTFPNACDNTLLCHISFVSWLSLMQAQGHVFRFGHLHWSFVQLPEHFTGLLLQYVKCVIISTVSVLHIMSAILLRLIALENTQPVDSSPLSVTFNSQMWLGPRCILTDTFRYYNFSSILFPKIEQYFAWIYVCKTPNWLQLTAHAHIWYITKLSKLRFGIIYSARIWTWWWVW